MTIRQPYLSSQNKNKAAAPDQTGRNVPLLTAAPFYKSDWGVQKDLPGLPPQAHVRNPLLYPNPIPFREQQHRHTTQVRQFAPPQLLPLNLNLFTNPIPFKQTEWSAPKITPDFQAPLQPYNLALYTVTVAVAPFYQTAWPVPSPLRSTQSSYVYNQPLYSVAVVAAPFYQNIWPVPTLQQPAVPLSQQNILTNTLAKPLIGPDLSTSKFQTPRAPDGTQQTNINLFTNPIPFAQTDWSSTKFSTARTPDQLAYNQSLYTVTIVASPFYQTDWPKSQPLKSALTQTYPNIALLNPVIVAAPFVPIDWQIQRRLQPQVPWSAPNLLNLLSMPFSQTNWPRAKTPAPASSVPVYNQSLYTTPGINANLSVTEADDTLSAAATLAIAASLTVTEGNDSLTAAATLAIAASASLVEANDTLVATAALAIVAASALTEAPDTLLADGINGAQNTADLAVTEANDTLSASATLGDVPVTGGGSGFATGPYTGPFRRKKKKKTENEELDELAEFLRAAAEVAPKPVLVPYKPIVYQGPLAAIFYEPIATIERRRTTSAVNEIMARAKAAQRREEDDEEALLLLI